jgi:hypothetical protein
MGNRQASRKEDDGRWHDDIASRNPLQHDSMFATSHKPPRPPTFLAGDPWAPNLEQLQSPEKDARMFGV